MQMGMQIGEQSEEIDELNEKYKRALRDKVDIYDELVESLKELVQRNARFMKNEVEITQLNNDCAILKRELEQKEKTIADIQRDIQAKDQEAAENSKHRIEQRQALLREQRTQFKKR